MIPGGLNVQISRGLATSAHARNKVAYIVGAARTPIGSFRSSLASLTAPQLASAAIKASLKHAKLPANAVQEVFLGQVCQANVGQAPARQATLGAGLEKSTAVTTVNKVCSSGLKAIILAAQQIQTGHQDVVIGGGMESMSQVPFYLPRGDVPYGGAQLADGIVKDGLTDAYDKVHMGVCGEKTARERNFTRKDQDEYAIGSYKKSASAWQSGAISSEVVPVEVKGKKGSVLVDKDEEFGKVNFDKFTSLKTVFQKDGTITAANASTLNDGAASVIVASEDAIKQYNLKPIAKILSYGDAARDPLDFAIAPPLLVPKLLKKAGLSLNDIDHWEVNEAFSVVVLAFIKELGIDASKVNPHGGAVSLGHPIGMSGARLITHMVHALKPGQKGFAAICNGGGGSSGMVIQIL